MEENKLVSVQEYCVQRLKEGDIIGVAPGGSKEAIFADVRFNRRTDRYTAVQKDRQVYRQTSA